MWLQGRADTRRRASDDARKHGIDTVFQDLALIDELSVYQNMFLHREKLHTPLPFLNNRRDAAARRARRWMRSGSTSRSIDVPVARLSGGQRQAIAVARTVSATPTSSCSTSRWRRWAPRRAR